MKNKTGILFLICLVWVYLVILAGGTVRATGAGLGCPDWPLCFGQIIPPLSENELPNNWRELVSYDSSKIVKFNVVHTWTEYINRLLGALLGVFTLLLVFSAKRFIKTNPNVFWCSLGALLSVGFNGWLGSLVVSSELKPVMVSLHMLGAFAVQAFLIGGVLQYRKTFEATSVKPIRVNGLKFLLSLCFVSLLVQIGLGIQIRESIDWIIKTSEQVDRGLLIELTPWIFYVHRSFSWIIFILALITLIKIYLNFNFQNNYLGHKSTTFAKIYEIFKYNPLFKYCSFYFVLVCSQMFIGGALNHLDFPIFAQPIHLLAANLLFGLLCFAWGSCEGRFFRGTSGEFKQPVATN